MHVIQFSPADHKLHAKEGLWCFQIEQMEMATLISKKKPVHYFIISKATPNIYVSKDFNNIFGLEITMQTFSSA